MTDHLAVARPCDLRALPEGLGQGGHADGGVEALSGLDHLDRIIAATDEQMVETIARALGLWRDHIIDMAPFLRPHIAQKVGPDRAGPGLNRRAIAII